MESAYDRRLAVAVPFALPRKKKPTDSLPGTVGKIEAMRRRHERGEPIFNADDRKAVTT